MRKRIFWSKAIGVILVGFVSFLVAGSNYFASNYFRNSRTDYLMKYNWDLCSRLSPLHMHQPGTMIGDVAPFDSSQGCKQCHEEIYNDWFGSMHSHEAGNPEHIALRSVIVKFDILRGDWCARCHEPVPWLEGRAQPNGEEYKRRDFFELNCDACHRMVDAVYPDPTALVCPQYGAARGYGSSLYAMQTYSDVKRGPRGDTTSAHGVMRDPFQRRSEHCGVCHDVSNPFAVDPMLGRVIQAPHTYGPAQRTYSEWLLSDFAKDGEAGTCQACHMVRQPGYSSTNVYRLDVARHDFAGGSTFLPDILHLFPEISPDVDTTLLRIGKERSIELQRNAAQLDVAAGHEGDSVTAVVRITNLIGHKLPTSVSARKMWINIVGLNDNGDTLFESGKYDFNNDVIIRDSQLKIYEFKPGMTARTAQLFGLSAGTSPYIGINDTIYFDNRIPPKGYSYAKFRERLAEPVGYYYADGQYWDDTRYRMTSNVTKVKVKLYYLSITRATIEWLRNNNVNNEFDRYNMGQRLYNAYFASGKAPPTTMDEAITDVQETSVPIGTVEGNPLPVKFQLGQNFPNPFNSEAIIEFWVSSFADVSLDLYDILGRKISTLYQGRTEGTHDVRVDASSLASGIYFYSLSVADKRGIKKLVLQK